MSQKSLALIGNRRRSHVELKKPNVHPRRFPINASDFSGTVLLRINTETNTAFRRERFIAVQRTFLMQGLPTPP
jgi:hypothetical protein